MVECLFLWHYCDYPVYVIVQTLFIILNIRQSSSVLVTYWIKCAWYSHNINYLSRNLHTTCLNLISLCINSCHYFIFSLFLYKSLHIMLIRLLTPSSAYIVGTLSFLISSLWTTITICRFTYLWVTVWCNATLLKVIRN